jgi:uncharacterized protein (DUF1330 family)
MITEEIMKTRYTVALAMLAGIGLGTIAVQGLHAQAKAPVYYVSEIDVRDADTYAKEYAPKAQAIIKAAGGRFVAVGGVGGNLAGRMTTFEGEAPKRLTIQVWDSLEKIKAWRDSKEFAEIRKVGEKYATFSRGFAIEGVPQ